jgi:hypothetical protein
MRAYHHLTESERNQVYALKTAGLTQDATAEQISGHLKGNDQPSVSLSGVTTISILISAILTCRPPIPKAPN